MDVEICARSGNEVESGLLESQIGHLVGDTTHREESQSVVMKSVLERLQDKEKNEKTRLVLEGQQKEKEKNQRTKSVLDGLQDEEEKNEQAGGETGLLDANDSTQMLIRPRENHVVG